MHATVSRENARYDYPLTNLNSKAQLCELAQTRCHCVTVVDKGAKMATISAKTRHLGVRVDLKMDHDLHAANSPSAHPRNGNLPHLSSIANGALE